MTWSDPIVEEVRRVRDAYAARFNYDLRAIFRDLKEQEKRSGHKLVSYAQGARGAEPTGAAIAASPCSTAQQAAPAVELHVRSFVWGCSIRRIRTQRRDPSKFTLSVGGQFSSLGIVSQASGIQCFAKLGI